jgi:ribosomal protein L11 methyltransferase
VGWHRLEFEVDAVTVDTLTEVLECLGAASVACEAASPEPRFAEPGVPESPHWAQNRIEALFPDDVDPEPIEAALTLLAEGRWAAPRRSLLEEADWSREWMKHYRPLAFGGGRLWVVPGWLEAPVPEAVNLMLDPGMAFGTGTHPSTALCLEWLAARALTGLDVLDWGTGSGILAIAALRLGATRALATDSDPVACKVARENAARNGVGDRFSCLPPEELPAGRQAILLANILLEPLLGLATTLRERVLLEGWLVTSGVLERQVPALEAGYRERGWRPEEIAVSEGWARVVFRPC